MSKLINSLGKYHNVFIYQRRINALAKTIAPLLKPGLVLDVGCGNGQFGSLLMTIRQDVQVIGLDVYLRPQNFLPVIKYDGKSFPFEDNLFSSIIVVDTLHHTDSFDGVLRECLRVTNGNIIVKDHFYRNFAEKFTLRLLDWVGNTPHGVALLYQYFTRAKWKATLRENGLSENKRLEEIPQMYPKPFQYWLGRNIQFVSELRAANVS